MSEKVMGNSRMQSLRDRSGSAAEKTTETAKSKAAGMSERASQAKGAARSAPHMAVERTQGNPLAAGVIAFGVGMLASSLIPRTRAEQDAVHRLRERSRGAMGPIKDAARESMTQVEDEARSAAQEARGRMKESATEAARATGQRGKEEARHMSEQSRER
ncbi:MAG TPA: hypothetical protein VI076_02245 [Actinopolymorphaceae bacterium]